MECACRGGIGVWRRYSNRTHSVYSTTAFITVIIPCNAVTNQGRLLLKIWQVDTVSILCTELNVMYPALYMFHFKITCWSHGHNPWIRKHDICSSAGYILLSEFIYTTILQSKHFIAEMTRKFIASLKCSKISNSYNIIHFKN